ncbi:MAG: hypothetical protein K2W96_02280 [Gemmataceae bacterium]|nr:hypothetical protein [Gemmataceae bacterium]
MPRPKKSLPPRRALSRWWMASVVVIVPLLLYFIAGLVQAASDPPSRGKTAALEGKKEAISDGTYTIDLASGGKAEVHEGMCGDRWYAAPDPKVVPLLSGELCQHAPTTGSLKMRLALMPASMAEDIAEALSVKRSKTVHPRTVDMLHLISLRVESDLPGVREYALSAVKATDYIDLSFKLDEKVDGEKLCKAIAAGEATFGIHYEYAKIALDDRTETFRVSHARKLQTVQDMRAAGAELFSARQAADMKARLKSEFVHRVVDGLSGRINPETFSMDKLFSLLKVPDLASMKDEDLRKLEARIVKQFKLGVDPAKFQPFKVAKDVVETLSDKKDVKKAVQAYLQEAENKKDSWSVVTGFAIGPFQAGGGYQQSIDKMKASGSVSADEFAQHLDKYHGVKYTTEEVLFRGCEVFDIQTLDGLGETEVTTVSVKPMLSWGTRSVTVTPSKASVERVKSGVEALAKRQAELEKKLKALDNRLAASDKMLKVLARESVKIEPSLTWWVGTPGSVGPGTPRPVGTELTKRHADNGAHNGWMIPEPGAILYTPAKGRKVVGAWAVPVDDVAAIGMAGVHALDTPIGADGKVRMRFYHDAPVAGFTLQMRVVVATTDE